MIEGRFEQETNRLFFEIGLVTADGEVFPVEALLDTGFTGWLALNLQDLESLNWEIIDDKQWMRTAQGEALFNVYVGTVQIDGQEFNIPVVAGDEIPEIIIGMEWLITKRLVVDLHGGNPDFGVKLSTRYPALIPPSFFSLALRGLSLTRSDFNRRFQSPIYLSKLIGKPS